MWTSSATFQLAKYININASGELRHDVARTRAIERVLRGSRETQPVSDELRIEAEGGAGERSPAIR